MLLVNLTCWPFPFCHCLFPPHAMLPTSHHNPHLPAVSQGAWIPNPRDLASRSVLSQRSLQTHPSYLHSLSPADPCTVFCRFPVGFGSLTWHHPPGGQQRCWELGLCASVSLPQNSTATLWRGCDTSGCSTASDLKQSKSKGKFPFSDKVRAHHLD